MRDDGLTFIEIAKQLGCSRACASRWCKLNDEQLKPKKRGIVEKIDPESKVKIKAEFLQSGLSARMFIKKIRPDLERVVSQRTVEKYLVGLRPQLKIEKAIHNPDIDLNNFCKICNKKFPEFCKKVRKNTNMNYDELKLFFGFERKSEDWRKWEEGIKNPLQSTKIKLAYLAYSSKFSHGEMLPSALIENEVYEQLIKINWDKLNQINAKIDAEVLIEDLVNYGRKIAGEPRKLRSHTYFKNDEFIAIGSKLLKPYFSFFKEVGSSATWITKSYYRMPSYLLNLILSDSYNQFYGLYPSRTP